MSFIDHLREQIESLELENSTLRADLAERTAERDEALLDTARLEWLGKSLLSCYPIVFDHDGHWIFGKWGDSCIRVSDAEEDWHAAPNFRYALDEAMDIGGEQ